MNKEKLLKLADHMEKSVSQEQYNQNYWFGGEDLVVETIDGVETVVFREGFCGTAGCIVGHACAIEAFVEDGLRIVKDPSGWQWVPMYKGITGFDAASLFFDIPVNHVEVLFGDECSYAADFYNENFTTQNVAHRLRDYVANPNIADALVGF